MQANDERALFKALCDAWSGYVNLSADMEPGPLRKQMRDHAKRARVALDIYDGQAARNPASAEPVAPWKWGYEYLQERMESIGRHGWAHDCDGEIEDRIKNAVSAAPDYWLAPNGVAWSPAEITKHKLVKEADWLPLYAAPRAENPVVPVAQIARVKAYAERTEVLLGDRVLQSYAPHLTSMACAFVDGYNMALAALPSPPTK